MTTGNQKNTNIALDERMREAVGACVTEFRDDHPNLAQALEHNIGCPIVDAVARELPTDSEYQNLVEQTKDETNVANIVSQLAPIVFNIIGKLL